MQLALDAKTCEHSRQDRFADFRRHVKSLEVATVLFSVTLAPTRVHETPSLLRTSFCGLMTTRAVSRVLKLKCLLLRNVLVVAI